MQSYRANGEIVLIALKAFAILAAVFDAFFSKQYLRKI